MNPTDSRFDVVVPADALSAALRSHIEANAAALGLQVETPLHTTARGDWLAARAVDRRGAQALRRQLQGLGLEARVELCDTAPEPAAPPLVPTAVADPISSPQHEEDDDDALLLDDWGSVLGSGPVEPVGRAPQPAPIPGLEPSPSLSASPPPVDDVPEPDDDTVLAEEPGGLPLLDWFPDEAELDAPPADAAPAPRPPSSPSAAAVGLDAAMSSVVDAFSVPASPAAAPSSATGPAPLRTGSSLGRKPAGSPGGAAAAAARRVSRPRPVPRLDDDSETWKRVLTALAVLIGISVAAFVLYAAWDVPESDAGAEALTDGRGQPEETTSTVTVSSGVAGGPPRTTAERARNGELDDPVGLGGGPDEAAAGAAAQTETSDRAEARELLQEARGRCQLEEFRACELTAEAAITLDPTLDAAYDLLLEARAGQDRAEREAAGEDIDASPDTPREPRVIIVSPDRPRPAPDEPGTAVEGSNGVPQGSATVASPPEARDDTAPQDTATPTDTSPTDAEPTETRPRRDPLGDGPLPSSPEELRQRARDQQR